MPLDQIRLPDTIEVGASGGPGFNTTVLESASGFEKRNVNWDQARGRWDVGYGPRHMTDIDGAIWAIQTIVAFFYARRGKAYTFLFRDWTDYVVGRQVIGVTNGVKATWQGIKTYEPSGPRPYNRDITKPVDETVQVWVNGALIARGAGGGQYQLDAATGIITLGATLAATTGQNIEWACRFDCHVRFDIDDIAVTALSRMAEADDPEATLDMIASIPSIPLIEVRG